MAKLLNRADVEAFAKSVLGTLDAMSEAADKLDRIRGILDEKHSFGATKAAPKRGKRRRPRGGVAEKVLLSIASVKGGLAAAEIGKIHNLSKNALRYALNKLRSDGKVRMSGNRSSALWHVTGRAANA